MVLPFAGLEMLGLLVAFRLIDRHAGDFELVAVQGDQVRLDLMVTGRKSSFEFNRLWAQVRCARDGRRLALASHGREIEFGRHLTAERRIEVARELQRELCRGR